MSIIPYVCWFVVSVCLVVSLVCSYRIRAQIKSEKSLSMNLLLKLSEKDREISLKDRIILQLREERDDVCKTALKPLKRQYDQALLEKENENRLLREMNVNLSRDIDQILSDRYKEPLGCETQK